MKKNPVPTFLKCVGRIFYIGGMAGEVGGGGGGVDPAGSGFTETEPVTFI